MRPCDVALDGAPHKKICGQYGPSPAGVFEFNIDFKGVSGYVYSVKYHDGRVTLCVSTRVSMCDVNHEKWPCCMSVKDWRLFCSTVCSDLDQAGFPKSIYVAQWHSSTGLEMYRIEADCFNHASENFIFLNVC